MSADGGPRFDHVLGSLAKPLVQRIVEMGRDAEGKYIEGNFIVGFIGDEIHTTGKTWVHVRNDPDAEDKIMERVTAFSKIKGANVYVLPGIVSPDLEPGKRGAIADTLYRFALVGDFDRHEGAEIDWAERLPIAPHMVVETSPRNFQTWIFLNRPYPPAELVRTGRALVPMLGDKEGVIGDMARVVRTPDTPNWPNQKKLDEGRSPEPFTARIALPLDEWSPGYPLTDINDAILKRDPHAFDRAHTDSAGKDEFDWNQRAKPEWSPLDDGEIASQLSNPKYEKDRSAGAFAFFKKAKRRGYTPEQIVKAMLDNSTYHVVHHYFVDGEVDEKRIREDVKRAFTKPDRPPQHQQKAEDIFRIHDSDNRADAQSDGASASAPFREIQILGGALQSNVDAAETAMIEQSVGIFQRGSVIVRPTEIMVEVREGKTVGDMALVEVKGPELIEHMTSTARFMRWDERTTTKWKPVNCPREIADVYLSRVGRWKLRPLAGVISAPTLRPDGSLIDRPGYDARTGLLYMPRGEFPAIPPEPSLADALSALGVIDGLISKFPFSSPAARAVALSAILTPLIRRSLPTAPMHAFSAPDAGAGKGLLVDTASVIASGREASPITQGGNAEETEKRLASLLMRGDPVVCLDNCTQPIGGDLLCAAMTQKTLKLRPLGLSRVVEVPTNATFFATGNNLTVLGDMCRRAVTCRIDPGCENPERRKFEFNPLDLARRDRGRYVAAGLTILLAYRTAGAPAQAKYVLGSFEAWSRTVRDALIWLGEADPCLTMESAKDGDPEKERLAAVIHTWREIIGDHDGARVTVKEAIDTAHEAATATDPKSRHPGLLDAFHAVAAPMVRSGDSQVDARRLGEWLKRHQGRIVGSNRLVPDGERDHVRVWRLERLG